MFKLLFTLVVIYCELSQGHDSDAQLKTFFHKNRLCSSVGTSLGLGYLDHERKYLEKSDFLKIEKIGQGKSKKECAVLKEGMKAILLEKNECDVRWLVVPNSKNFTDVEFLFSGIHVPPKYKTLFTNFLDLTQYKFLKNDQQWQKLDQMRLTIQNKWLDKNQKKIEAMKKQYRTDFLNLKKQWIKNKKITLKQINYIDYGLAGCH